LQLPSSISIGDIDEVVK